jgi:hypothetical protein
MFHVHESVNSNLSPNTGYCEYSFHDLSLSAHKCGYTDKGIFHRCQILHLFIFKFKNMYNTDKLLCTQYPSHQSNGNIIMESITRHVICKKTTDHSTNHHDKWCEIHISLAFTLDRLY